MARSHWSTQRDPVGFDQAFAMLGPSHVAMARRIVEHLLGSKGLQWRSLGRFVGPGMDRLDVERSVQALFEAGWITKRMRQERIGESRPTSIMLRERGWIAYERRWPSEPQPPQAEPVRQVSQLLAELRDDPSRSPPFPERLVVQRALGSTKALRLRDHRAVIEAALGQAMEELVLFHTDSLLTAGPVRYRFRGVAMDLRGSWPWSCLPLPVVEGLEALRVEGAREILCVENQTPFEILCRQARAQRAVLVFTAGYAGRAQRRWLVRLCLEAGIRRVRHWGDLDPHGLLIQRDLARLLADAAPGVKVEPWRMDPEQLQRPEAVPLSEQDREQLERYLQDGDAPLRATARAMLKRGVKLEQEALLG